MIKYDANLLL